jgi:hypothetical protein
MEDPLFIKQFTTSVRRQPLNTHYQVYQADSSTTSGVTWNIDSPFAGALLDNEAYVKYTVTFAPGDDTLSDMFQRFDNANTAGSKDGLGRSNRKLAFRQGFAINNALSNCEVVINGQSLRQTPQRYMGVFARYYSHPSEIDGVCSMSGGELDCGSHSAVAEDDLQTLGTRDIAANDGILLHKGIGGVAVDGAFANNMNINTYILQCPPATTDNYCNTGYTKRVHRLHEKWRSAGPANDQHAANTNTAYPNDLTIEVYERLPISPFLLWEAKDKKRSIPYVDKMEVNLTFHSNLLPLVFQGTQSAANLAVGAGVSWVGNAQGGKPELHLKWYIPPPGMAIPPEISIPVSQYKESVRTVAVAAPVVTQTSGTPTTGVNYENLRLQQIPDIMFIYVKPVASAVTFTQSTEHHVEITAVEITVNGDSGKALRASSGRLFSMYCRNSPMRSRKHEYEQWRKRYCTLALKPSDLGVRVPPGVNHGVTLDVRLEVANWWALPTVKNGYGAGNTVNQDVGDAFDYGVVDGAIQYEIHILGIYDKYELTLTNRGNAQLKLQNMPSLDLPQSLAVVDRQDLRAQFA